MKNVVLNNVDLSESNINIFYKIEFCGLRNTNIKIDFTKMLHIKNSDISYNDFSYAVIPVHNINRLFFDGGIFSNLSYTGIKFRHRKVDYTGDYSTINYKNNSLNIYNIACSGAIDGCYVNGKFVDSKSIKQKLQSKKEEKETIRKQYEEMKSDILNSITDSVNIAMKKKKKYN